MASIDSMTELLVDQLKDLRDAVIIGSAQRVEHYEMAAYGTAIAHARLLQHDDVVTLLEQSLERKRPPTKNSPRSRRAW